MSNFFAELKRRNVYKVAVAYAVVAWLVIQAASILLPTFDAPPWVMKVLVLVIVLGFPAALVFSWAFEITPEGIKLESEIEPNKSIARRTGRKIVAVTIALAVVAAGLFVYQLVGSRSTSTPQNTASAARTEAATIPPNKSNAALPFDNLSRDPDNAYFGEGVQDEILTRLAKVADLKVISRTSTQHFKSTPDNLPQLAQAHASSGLLATLELDLDRAIRELERAIQLNPNYATAHHWLALPLMAIGQFDRAIVEAKRAIELDPLSLICNSDLGWIYFNARRYDEAEAQARKTLEMDSRFAVAHYYLGEVFQFKGRLNDAIAEYQKAFDLNNDPFSFAMLGQAYARQGKTDEARKVLARLSEEAKSRYISPYALAVVLTALGEKAQAIDELERSYDERGFYIALISVDPLFDDLRGDPRFDAVVQKIVSGKK